LLIADILEQEIPPRHRQDFGWGAGQ